MDVAQEELKEVDIQRVAICLILQMEKSKDNKKAFYAECVHLPPTTSHCPISVSLISVARRAIGNNLRLFSYHAYGTQDVNVFVRFCELV